MKILGAEILRTEGDYEEAVDFSQKLALEKEYYDANPGGANTHLQLISYAEIAYEIYDALRDAPKVLAAPVSNGTMLAGIHRGFATLYKRGKTSRSHVSSPGLHSERIPSSSRLKKDWNIVKTSNRKA